MGRPSPFLQLANVNGNPNGSTVIKEIQQIHDEALAALAAVRDEKGIESVKKNGANAKVEVLS